MFYQQIIEAIYEEVQAYRSKGTIAAYIPQLAQVDPDKMGMSLLLLDGTSHSIGDATEPFSIQSISKTFAITMAISLLGEQVWQRVGVEPSGDPFNSLFQLEYEQGIPRNPFINAGAIVIADLLMSQLPDPKVAFLQFVRKLSDDSSINYNQEVARSEKENGFRNIALANLMRSYHNIFNDVEAVLDFYFHMCSLEMSCNQLAKAFLVYANQGRLVHNGEAIINPSQCKRLNALMLSCGFYDEAGEFAFRVGLPGKSGVGGGIAALHPGYYSIATWSPRLNAKGNSLLGMKALESFTTRTGLSIF